MSIKEALQKKLKGLRTGTALNYLERLSTGIAPLDAAIGGGLPLRRVVQIYGPESVGKSALALNIIRYVQQHDPTAEAFYIDCEATVTKDDIEALKLDGERLFFYNPVGGEDAYDSALDALQAGAKIAVIDSVPFLRPKKVLDEIDKNSEYRDVSSIALLMERVQHKIVHTLEQSDGVLIFINQARPSKSMYSPRPTYPGGSSLSFMLSLNILISSVEKKKGSADLMTQRLLVCKNKTATPLTEAEISYYERLPLYGKCLLSAAKKAGIVDMKGAGFYSVSEKLAEDLGLPSAKLGQGEDKVAADIEANPELYKTLYELVIKEMCAKPQVVEIEQEMAASIYDN